MALHTRSGRNPSQDPQELDAFIELLQKKHVRRYLEIGARHGDTFYEVMTRLPHGSTGVAIDLPGGPWGKSSSVHDLLDAVDALCERGYTAHYLLADSQQLSTREQAIALAPRGRFDNYPFDAVLIDGDHRYAGVARDWELYGLLAPIVAFHDIAGEGQTTKDKKALPVEVPRFWAELRKQPALAASMFHEFISHDSKMGIGVVCHS